MAINFVRTRDASDDSIRFQPMERLKLYLFGATVLFASFGMGEAVYRLLFSEFDGITDRIPVEVLFGLVFAWLATKFGGVVYRNRKERSARLNFIWARNHQIRGALEGITPLAHPSKNQQSIRVIREEVDRIEWALRRSCRAKLPCPYSALLAFLVCAAGFLPGGSGLCDGSLGAGDCSCFVHLPLRHVGQFANLPISHAIQKIL